MIIFMNIECLHREIKEQNVESIDINLISDSYFIEVKSKLQFSYELKFFTQELSKLLENNQDGIVKTKQKIFTYYIEDNPTYIYELLNKFNNEFIIPTSNILGDLPTRGNVITKVSKCGNYVVVSWDGAGLFFIKLGDNHGYIFQTRKNDNFISMLKYFLITPFVFLNEIYLIHGGIVNYKNKNYLITNEGGKGKTTFLLLFLSNGGKVITEDISYISKRGKILRVPVRSYFNLRLGTYKAFKNLFPKKMFESIDKSTYSNYSNYELFKLGRKDQIRLDVNLIWSENNLRFLDECLMIDNVIIPDISPTQETYLINKVPNKTLINMIKSDMELVTIKWFKYFISYKNNTYNFAKIFENLPVFYVKTDLNYKIYFNEFIDNIENN